MICEKSVEQENEIDSNEPRHMIQMLTKAIGPSKPSFMWNL